MIIRRTLQYVRNTGGGATKANFIEDHEPIGEMLWQKLRHGLYVYEDMDGRIQLTDSGNAELDKGDGFKDVTQ